MTGLPLLTSGKTGTLPVYMNTCGSAKQGAARIPGKAIKKGSRPILKIEEST